MARAREPCRQPDNDIELDDPIVRPEATSGLGFRFLDAAVKVAERIGYWPKKSRRERAEKGRVRRCG